MNQRQTVHCVLKSCSHFWGSLESRSKLSRRPSPLRFLPSSPRDSRGTKRLRLSRRTMMTVASNEIEESAPLKSSRALPPESLRVSLAGLPVKNGKYRNICNICNQYKANLRSRSFRLSLLRERERSPASRNDFKREGADKQIWEWGRDNLKRLGCAALFC